MRVSNHDLSRLHAFCRICCPRTTEYQKKGKRRYASKNGNNLSIKFDLFLKLRTQKIRHRMLYYTTLLEIISMDF